MDISLLTANLISNNMTHEEEPNKAFGYTDILIAILAIVIGFIIGWFI